METLNYTEVRSQLIERRTRVENTVKDTPADHLINLLHEIDLALERIDSGVYGLCEVCGDPIEEDRIKADPLLRVCLGDLSKIQQKMLEDDLSLASRIQSTLLPKNDFKKNGWEVKYHYEPAGVVSGDYCDIVETGDGKKDLYFIIADVSGKGFSASLLMTHIHAMFHSLIAFELPVNVIVERANRLFCESTLNTHYATLVVGKVDHNGNMEICNAGHCPPLIFGKMKKEAIKATGVPIGLFCTSEYTIQKHALNPGDTLLIYTDGLSESFRANEEYGTGRIEDNFLRYYNLPLNDIMNYQLNDVKEFTGNAPKSDDLTLMLVRWNGVTK